MNHLFFNNKIQATSCREIAFLDPAIADLPTLAASLRPEVHVCLLESHTDGLAQIGAVLLGMRHIEAIHIFSHGSPGLLQLGHGWLTHDDLLQHAGEIQSWRLALAPQASILLYGCQVAANGEGRQLVTTLADLSGATVAAADDLTGHGDLGGDWDLEVTTGPLSSRVAITPQGQAQYQGVLLPGYDEPASTSTQSSLTVNAAASTGDIATRDDHDWWRVSLVAGTEYTFDLMASDTNYQSGLDAYLTLRNGSGTTIDEDDDGGDGTNARLYDTPSQSGTYYLDAGSFDDASSGGYTIRVVAATAPSTSTSSSNRSPVVTSPRQTEDQYVFQGETFSYILPANTFQDPDGDALTLSVRNLPTWLSFSASTRTFAGRPTANGEDFSVTITARDPGGLSTSSVLDFFVAYEDEDNQPPIVDNPIADRTWREGRSVRFVIPRDAFRDPEGEPLTYSASLRGGRSLPSWLSFNPTLRTFRGRAPIGGPDLQIRITATDPDGLSVSDDVVFRTTNSGRKLVAGGLSFVGGGENAAIGSPSVERLWHVQDAPLAMT